MKVSYHLMIEEEHLKVLKHKAIDENISVHRLIINTLNDKHDFIQKKERTSVRKKRKLKKVPSG